MNINTVEKIELVNSTEARDVKLRDTSRKMEAAFLTYVFKTMEKTIPKSKLSGAGGNNLATMMFSTVMADAVSEQGGIGLGDQIYQSLKTLDEIPNLEDLNLDGIANSIHSLHLLDSNFKK
jgi:Rod binding domain-containing protein